MSTNRAHVYLFQFSDKFGDEIYLPYAVGLLWAYAKSVPAVAENFVNKGFVFVRENPALIASRLENPAVAAFSTYVWNWEMSAAVAREVKARNPNCLIVMGGPQVPNADRLGDFFEKYPFIDIIVHGEGEYAFAEILAQQAGDRDFSTVKGITYRGASSAPRPRTRDLGAFPSPYLEGIFEELFELPYRYNAVWESNRGCPYGCTFCDWGSNTMQKLTTFLDERIVKEIEYFGAKKISHVFMADANFGIVPRDVEIAKHLAKTKRETGGFPTKLRVNYAKNNPDRVHEIAKILNAEGLDKGITLSVQSMDDGTLKTIKRKNLKFDTISSFIKKYQRDGIYTYTEIIMGLPGETYETFREGINRLLEAAAHDTVWMYRCTLLPNAPMNDLEYREKHKLRTVRTPIALVHTPPNSDPVPEFEDTIVETATLSRAEYKRMLLLAWALQTFHSLSMTQMFAIYANESTGLSYTDFYDALLNFAANRPDTIVGSELQHTREKIDEAIEQGGNWDNTVPEFSDITWTFEEASYLRIQLERDRFYREIGEFLGQLEAAGVLSIEPRMLQDLMTYQKALVVKWEGDGSTEFDLEHSIHSWYRAILTGGRSELQKGRFRVSVVDPFQYGGDRRRYSTEIVFWGRRTGKLTYKKVEERALDVSGVILPGVYDTVERQRA
jgi:radical SAM superfamily enzyme YgiQ (UPF0313 family)